MDYTGTPDSDHEIGTADDDNFNMQQAGNDIVEGRGGDDVIDFGQAYDSNDQVFGGKGMDTLMLSGGHDVHDFVTLDSIEKIVLADGFTYGFQLASSTVAAGHTLTMDASALTLGHMLDFEDPGEDGNLVVKGGATSDVLFSGSGRDVLYGGDGGDSMDPGTGTDRVYGGAGVDSILFSGAGALDASDRIDGGADGANLTIYGDYSTGLTLGTQTILHVTHFTLGAGSDYKLDFHNLHAPGAQITVDADALASTNVLRFTAKGNNAGFNVYGGGGNDVITLGGGENDFHGNAGGDVMTLGSATDTLFYNTGGESLGSNYDTVVGFNTHEDFFNVLFTGLNGHVEGVDHIVNHGKLTAAHFETNLASALGSGELGSYHAVLFHPDAGGLAGEWYLIVDADGEAGYQGADDMVVHLKSSLHITDLSPANFGTPG